MIRSRRIHTTTRSVAVSMTAAALAMFSQTAGAQGTNLAGAWKINPTKSNFSAGSASLSIARGGPGMDKSSGPFLVVSDDGNVYLASAAAMQSSAGFKRVDYAHAQTAKMLLIGTNARRDDVCGFRCQSGLMERSLTLRFNSVDGAEQLMGEMLAYKSSKP